MAIRSISRVLASPEPRALLRIYAGVQAALVTLTALAPGEPSYGRGGASAETAIATTALLVLFLRRRSRLAWWISLLFDAGGAAIFTLVAVFPDGGLGFGAKALLAALLSAAATAILVSPSVERFVAIRPHRAPDEPAASAPRARRA